MGRGPVGAPALVKYNDQSVSEITEIGAAAKDAMVLIKTVTASSSATVSFVDGSDDVVLDDTYPIYLFKFINIHSSADGAVFTFNLSIDTGSNYNVTKTSTFIEVYHNESDGGTPNIGYGSSHDLAQSTGFQRLTSNLGNDNDQSSSGELWLYNPSSTTFVKHFMSNLNSVYLTDYTQQDICAGYGNTTSAVDAVQFKFESGNIDAGTFKLYGIKDS